MRLRVMAHALGFVLLGAPLASAQSTGQDVATAQALFDEGKRLMAAGQYADACPKLEESQRIDPGGGTAFAIALCHEGEGKTATAWAEFTAALADARRDKRSDREIAAAEHVRALEGKLTRVRVSAATKVDGLEIRRDGARLGEAQWGLPLPLDPGQHTFAASAPGKRPWKQVVEVKGEAAVIDVLVPALENEPKAVAVEAPPMTQPAATPVVATTTAPAAESSQRTWAIATGAVGLVVVGVGLGFGLSASSKWNDAEQACPGSTCPNASAKKLGDDAGTAADVSTALVTVGAVGLVAGAVLWLTAPSGKQDKQAVRISPTASFSSVGLSVGGAL